MASWHGAKGDVEAVCAVDRYDRERQIDELLFAELRPSYLIDFIRDVTFGDTGHGFTPGKCRAFPVAVEGGLLPGVEEVKPLLAFPHGAELLHMHVNTMSTTVDLGSAQFDQLQKSLIEAATMNESMESPHRLH